MCLQIEIVTFRRIFVLALVLKRHAAMQKDDRVLQMVFVAEGVLVAGYRSRVVDQAVALALPVRHVAFELFVFLARETSVAGFVDIRGNVVFANRELLICPLDPLLNTATRKTQHRQYE
jgi:hypothetical protein